MKNSYILFVITFILFNPLNRLIAQCNIPTLKQQLRAPSADSCQLLFELGKAYESVHLDSCFYFLNSALERAKRKNNNQAIAQTMQRIGSDFNQRIIGIEWRGD